MNWGGHEWGGKLRFAHLFMVRMLDICFSIIVCGKCLDVKDLLLRRLTVIMWR